LQFLPLSEMNICQRLRCCIPLAADLGVKGAALAARELIADNPAEVFAKPIGVNEGESTLRLFLDLLLL
jgi:hypothetical protein